MTDKSMLDLIETLFPICRSITGDGVRQTLTIIQDIIPLEVVEVPSGTQVFDWQVPKEWNVIDAYIKDSAGNRVIDFQQNNLHLLNYSTPVNRVMSLKELKPHLYSLPDQPDLIPYRTSYYDENWGFCLSHNQLKALNDDDYEVVIDSSLEMGSLSYGEFYLPGRSEQEVLISAHICHPSLCNDNLSGIAVATFLANELQKQSNRYSYRFVFIPATIGAITWLARNEDKLGNIKHGLVASNLADAGSFTYKKSRSGSAGIDRIVEHVLRTSGVNFEVRNFSPYGYDERQFGSPGINLPIGNLSRTPYGEYAEYHTSADNLSFISPNNLQQSLEIFERITSTLEECRYFCNLQPKGEPQLGRRGLYKKVGGQTTQQETQMAMLWLLNMSDGNTSLLEIAELSGIDLPILTATAENLVAHGLLQEIVD